jgi:predicted nuclease of restriction endonuclease-like (RecB) superfamily
MSRTPTNVSKHKAATTRGAKTRSSAPTQRVAAHLGNDVAPLVERVVTIVEEARSQVVRTVNNAMVLSYWHIGREIVEFVQRGAARAEYGDQVIDLLSLRLQARVGRGYSSTNLKYFRIFYQVYAARAPAIRHEPSDESESTGRIGHEARDRLPANLSGFSSRLSWTHYRTLTKVEESTARAFYEIEADREGWSTSHLERQIHTQLFARLLKSRNKTGALDLARRGQLIERPIDLIKSPIVLDFLDLPDREVLHESDIERAILSKLSQFILELGKGFAFVARQKRLTFADEEFYIDLVFYNIVLKCFLLIDLKLGKLTHQDIGQMDTYVKLYDAHGRTPGDGPTIGLILCAEKNETVARYSILHEHEQLFAAKYVTYLPTVEELERELQRDRQFAEAVAPTNSTTCSNRKRRPGQPKPPTIARKKK